MATSSSNPALQISHMDIVFCDPLQFLQLVNSHVKYGALSTSSSDPALNVSGYVCYLCDKFAFIIRGL
jgi:hypothetical protein